eukprot:m.322698 g.322698  ORF g.322698 m.322698 type:complete len:59 (+) comp16534_c0_seq2:2672-2848(+)
MVFDNLLSHAVALFESVGGKHYGSYTSMLRVQKRKTSGLNLALVWVWKAMDNLKGATP